MKSVAIRRFFVGSLCIALGTAACGGKQDMLQELEKLKVQIEESRKENESLNKQVALLSATVQQLSELNAVLQQGRSTEHTDETPKVEPEKIKAEPAKNP